MKTQKLDTPPLPPPDSDKTLPSLASDPHPSDEQVGPGVVLQGKYRLDRLLGSGGMGAVYRGEHLTLGVPIAIKVLHPRVASFPENVRRFRREAHAVSRLHHPNVVRVLDFDEDPERGVAFLVMDFLEGGSLSDWLDSQEVPPPLAQIVPIVTELFSALGAAHALGIVHRDLKPENVFLAREGDGRRVVKVVDFGLAHVDDARDAGPTLTQADIVAGTPHYMSPEQCKSLAVGPSTDIYAAGCLLTDLLQLRPPFGGKSPIEVISKQMFMPPPPLDRPPGAEPIPPLLDRLRLDLLAKSPEQRPADMKEALARFLEAMSPEASEARLPARKGDEPLGGRSERLPSWGEGGPPGAAPTSQGAPGAAARTVQLLRLEAQDRGVNELCVTGLAAQGIAVTEIEGEIPRGGGGGALIVLDAGARLDAALELLSRAGGEGAPRVVVCGVEINGERMNQLIAAGASDVVLYPVNSDVLAKRIERVMKRRR